MRRALLLPTVTLALTLALCIAMMSGILRQLKAREANAG